MNPTIRKYTAFFIIFTIVLSFAVLSSIVAEDYSASVKQDMSWSVGFKGVYSIEGEDTEQEIPEDYEFSLSGKHTVFFRGNFTSEIPANLCLITKARNIKASIKINGKLLTQHGTDDDIYVDNSKLGNSWVSFISPGIFPDDDVIIRLQNNYFYKSSDSYKDFFSKMHIGHEKNVIVNSLKGTFLSCFIAIFIISMGIVVCIFSISTYKTHPDALLMLVASFMYIFCGLWFLITFAVDNSFFTYSVFSSGVETIGILMSISFIMLFFAMSIKNRMQPILFFVSILWFIATVIFTCIQKFNFADYYDFLPFIGIAVFISIILVAFGFVFTAKDGMKSNIQFRRFGFLFIFLGVAADIVSYIITKVPPDLEYFSIGVRFFLIIFFLKIVQNLRSVVYENIKVHFLEEQTKLDAFTGLYNKVATEKLINAAIENKSSEANMFAFFIVDIDNFKNVNDNFGHAIGDTVILELTGKFKANFRSTDIIGRIGGDEFVIFIPIPDMKWIYKKAGLLSEHARMKIGIGSPMEHTVTTSIGISVCPRDGASFEKLYKNADKALYKVKERGKNGYHIYEGDSNSEEAATIPESV